MSSAPPAAATDSTTDASASAAPGEKLSKNAEKRLAKQAKKDASKVEKAAETKEKEKESKSEKKKQLAEDDETDPDRYFDRRVADLKVVEEKGTPIYPHKFHVSISIPQLVLAHSNTNMEKGQRTEQKVAIAGRVYSKRSSGTALYFYDVHSENGRVQIVADRNSNSGDFAIHETIRRGDVIGCVGVVGRSNTGELSVFPSEVRLLSPCLRMLPNKISGLKDQEQRYRQRYLDLMINQPVRQNFYIRSKIINYIRRFLDERGFLEVETPMMSTIAGGAAARPFKTFHNDLNLDMVMRIAPELYLKQLVVGGFDRVYEIGRQFRNEGLDTTHNPEFTSVEFYWAYNDYEDLIKVTEEMLSGLVYQILGTYEVKYQPDPSVEAKIVNFKPPWKRINMLEGLEEKMGVKIPRELHTPEAAKFVSDLCLKHEVKVAEPRTTARMLDKLVGKFIEDGIVNPTFICEHPEIMSPLAKFHRSKPGVTERFELFCLEKELCNAYTELNNPMIQRQRFEEQLKDKAAGDDEAQQLDEGFVHALEHGLPPTAGWGLGIDRLTMFLTNTDNIKEVLLFPAMKPEEHFGSNKEKEKEKESVTKK